MGQCSLSPQSKTALGLNLCVELDIFPVPAWVSSRCPGYLLQYEDMQIRLE